MLSFYTEFPVEETKVGAFCHSVAKWIDGSQHTSITAQQVLDIVDSRTGSWADGKQQISCEVYEAGEFASAGFKYFASVDDVEWTTTVCFSVNDVDSWVSVKTERQSTIATPHLPEAKKPFVVRTLMEGLRGGVDGELRVSDTPYILSENDVSMVVRILNGDSEHHLPIVYLSFPFVGGHFVNAEALSRHLAGVAHVLVEPSREFSRRIEKDVFSANPYGGYVGIIYNQNRISRIPTEAYDSEFDVRRLIFQDIRQALLNRRVMTRCSWSNIEALSAQLQRKQLEASGSESIEEYAKAFDKEISAKDDQLSEAEREIFGLRQTLAEMQKRGGANSKFSLKFGGEQEFSDDEFLEIVLDGLQNAMRNTNDQSRRQDVIQAILDSNTCSRTLAARQEEIKNILRGYRNLNSTIRSDLQRMGFEISEDGKHHKLCYRGDQRYTFSLPKSGSDNRGGLNAATDIARRAF